MVPEILSWVKTSQIMNKYYLIVALSITLNSCIGKHSSNAQVAEIKKESTNVNNTGDTIKINLSQSTIHWKGTKMNGAGKHEGNIELQEAFFLASDENISGGKFVVDMNSITVTDIPEHEPVPKKRFIDHIKSEDFFNVKAYPTSKFEITKTELISNDSLKISGNLTLKEITNNITFQATMINNIFKANFTIDRFLWNIAYEGNIVDKTLVDKEIEFYILFKKN